MMKKNKRKIPVNKVSNMDLIGNLVKIQNCPRNCKCGRNKQTTVKRREGLRVERRTSQETCLIYNVKSSSGVRRIARGYVS